MARFCWILAAAVGLAGIVPGCGFVVSEPLYRADSRSVRAELERRQRAKPHRLEQVASTYLGVPYRWGGNTRQGMDCSAWARAVFRETYGIELPRTTGQMYQLGRQVDSLALLRPGDLVFFGKTPKSGKVDHVGVYLGRRRFAHASVSRGGTVSSFDQPYYRRHYAGARRLLP